MPAVVLQELICEAVAGLGGSSVWNHVEYMVTLQLDLHSKEEESPTSYLASPHWTVRRRFSDFQRCHLELCSLGMRGLPQLPSREPILQRFFGSLNSRTEWLETHRQVLQAYIEILLCNSEFMSCPSLQAVFASAGPSRLLSTPPEPPASLRVRVTATSDLGNLEVEARQASTSNSPLEAVEDGEEHASSVPVAEIVVVFTGADPNANDEYTCKAPFANEVAARVRLCVKDHTEAVCGVVQIPTGRAYTLEARSVSIAGVQSNPLVLSVLLPTGFQAVKSERSHSDASDDQADSGTIENSPGHCEHSAGNQDFDFKLCRSKSEEESGNLQQRVVEPGEGVASPRQTLSLCPEDESAPVQIVPNPRRDAEAWLVHQVRFTGKAATEWVSVATEKARKSYEHRPFTLLPPSINDATPTSRSRVPFEKRHKQVEVEGAESSKNPIPEDSSVHKPAEQLDSLRKAAGSKRKVEDVKVVAAWVASVSGSQDGSLLAAAATGDLKKFQLALLSGEVLCELVNVAAAFGKDEGGNVQTPVPGYHKTVENKFRCMENISNFIGACRWFFQVPEHQLFCTSDLFEGRNMLAVVRCITALGGRIQALYPDAECPRLGVPFSPRTEAARSSTAEKKSNAGQVPLRLEGPFVAFPFNQTPDIRQSGARVSLAFAPKLESPRVDAVAASDVEVEVPFAKLRTPPELSANDCFTTPERRRE